MGRREGTGDRGASEREGVRGPGNVRTAAMPLRSASAERRPARPGIFQMPDPCHGVSPGGSHSLGACGGGAGSCLLRPCLGRVWNPDVQCSVGGNQPQLKGRLPRTGLGMVQEGSACADCRLLTQGEGRVLCPRVTGTAGHRTSDGQTRQFISHMYSPHTIVHRDTRGQGKQVGLWEAGWVLSRGWGTP